MQHDFMVTPPPSIQKYNLVERTCKKCSRTFGAQRWMVEHGRGQFCSRSCLSRFHVGKGLRIGKGELNGNWKGGISKIKSAYKKRYRASHPKAARAHDAVRRAVKSGKLVKLPCETCGGGKAHAHHDDYDKPLVVRWLCGKCHRIHHGATC